MPAAIMRHVLFGAFTLTCMLTAAGLARAEVVNLKASMDAKSEVPPNSSPATGTVTATYDTSSKKLSWKGNYSGLSGPATAAHFHSGESGKNGPIVVPITPHNESIRGLGYAHRPSGRRAARRKMVCERAHGGQQGRRNPRSGDQINVRRNRKAYCPEGNVINEHGGIGNAVAP